MKEIFYAAQPNTALTVQPNEPYSKPSAKQLLLGARLHVDLSTLNNGWVEAETVPNKAGDIKSGFIERSVISDRQQLKIFYIDVGQGDATLIEAENVVIVIDGGPNRAFADKLNNRLESLRRADAAIGKPPRQRLHIDILIVSHFDLDHHAGLKSVVKNQNFSFGTVYHNGLPRYGGTADKDLNLGSVVNHGDGTKSISADLRDLQSAQRLIDDGLVLADSGNLNKFGKLMEAMIDAHAAGRLGKLEMLVKRDPAAPPQILSDTGDDIEIEVLGPVTTKISGPIKLRPFPNPHGRSSSVTESHTINGNSIVLKLKYGQNTFLFGGDLNQPAQNYLSEKYGDLSKFEVQVNKACHHGASDYDMKYVKAVKPNATVFSSGDNGSYDHPMPDVMGAAAKHSKGGIPLIFSTELARETDSNGNVKMLGHINARSNGDVIVMAQKKESPRNKNKLWYTFPLPYAGPFH